jgi:nicotinate phosphoribosyltransferase
MLLDLYELTMAQSYFVYKKDALATFDLFVRDLPSNRAYLVACGLQDVLGYIRTLRFTEEELRYLGRQRIFSQGFLRYLSNFRFRGEIWALREGEIFFSNEPVIRVTAPIIEAQIIESFLLNTVNLQTMIASKAARVVTAANDECGVYDFSLRRTHGKDAGIKAARSSYIAGFGGTSNVLAAKSYKIPAVGTMAHSFVMSFRHEMDSFLAYSESFPKGTTLLVDTYDTKRGIDNAIAVGLYLKEKGHRLRGIRLDSGDIVSLSKHARRKLDAAGLDYVGIFASGNLDEFKIKDLGRSGAEVDNFGVGTNMGTSIDAPCLDIIYKISEVTDENSKFLPTMKLSRGKVSYPGRKQVFRQQDKRGNFIRDILGLDKEKIKGRPLLIKVVDKGRVVYKSPLLEATRAFVKKNLSRLPKDLREPYFKYKYPVFISPKLKKLRRSLAAQLVQRQ